jgi:hypothetical protein
MFLLNETLQFIEAAEPDVVAVYRSVEPVLLAPAGRAQQPCHAFLCVVRKNDRQCTYAALNLVASGETLVYAPDPSFPFASVTIADSLSFLEAMGFRMESLDLQYNTALREVVVRGISVIQPPGTKRKAVPPKTGAKTATKTKSHLAASGEKAAEPGPPPAVASPPPATAASEPRPGAAIADRPGQTPLKAVEHPAARAPGETAAVAAARDAREQVLADELAAARAELTQNRAELTQNRAELTQNRAELTQNRAELTQTKAELAQAVVARGEAVSAHSELEALKEEYELLRNEYGLINEELTARNDDLQRLAADKEAAEEAAAAGNAALKEELKARNYDLQRLAAEKEAAKESAATEIAALKATVARLTTEKAAVEQAATERGAADAPSRSAEAPPVPLPQAEPAPPPLPARTKLDQSAIDRAVADLAGRGAEADDSPFSGDESDFPDDGPTLFHVDNSLPSIPCGECGEILELLHSLNMVRINSEGNEAQNCSAYICGLRQSGSLRVYSALYLTESKKALVYVPDKQPSDEDTYSRVMRAGLLFMETVGFVIDALPLENDPALRLEALKKVPVFVLMR